MQSSSGRQRQHLREIAQRVMRERGLEPDFPVAAQQELALIHGPAQPPGGDRGAGGDPGAGRAGAGGGDRGAGPEVRDQRALLWASIDNDDSRDLDQLTVAEALPGGAARVLVAIADVDAVVARGSALDQHAARNTTSVYTAAQIFPMLPEKLSTDLTSLGENADRMAVVIAMEVGADGGVGRSELYRALVRNQAKLAYNAVGDWLEGRRPEPPPRVAAVHGMEAQLRLQDEAAQRLRRRRFEHGALNLETVQPRPVFEGDTITDLEAETRNRAKELIEDFMIAANGCTAVFLEKGGFPSLRRVVRTPKRWPRLIELAASLGAKLPPDPDVAALSAFLDERRRADPARFPDLSVTVVKLLGSGEYVVDPPGGEAPGHFGLAVRDYTHSTAPNRRFPDVITQRLVKAALGGRACPYALDELGVLAAHCTEKEDDAQKVERQVAKSAAAMLLSSRLGQIFDGVVTGASDKGTWARIFHPPVEGRIVRGLHGLDVGDKVRVKLVDTDVERGYIDFERA
jgi:VacB/RNase II family 3'-5' exoribonuclease